jgi:hypothetical protein
MEFKSTINYFLVVARFIFILVCLFYFGLCFSSYSFSKNPYGDIIVRIIVIIGMLWGIYVTVRGLLFRTRIVLITGGQIIIREIFRNKENIYSIGDIKYISSGAAYDMGNYSKGIKLRFKNGDNYEFIWYDFLNFRKMKTAFGELKKISEKTFI